MFVRIICSALRLNARYVIKCESRKVTVACIRRLTVDSKLRMNKKTVEPTSVFIIPSEDIYLLDAIRNQVLIEGLRVSNDISVIERSPFIKKFYDLLVKAASGVNTDFENENCKNSFANEVYDELCKMPRDALITLFKHIYSHVRSGSIKDNNVEVIERILRERLWQKVQKFSIDDFNETFAVSNLLLAINRETSSHITDLFILKGKDLLKNMDITDFCLYMMVVKSSRKPLPRNVQVEVEMKFLTILPKLTTKQCALICGAFFKTKMKIMSLDLVESIVNFVSEKDDLFNEDNSIGLSCILKSLKLISRSPDVDFVERMMNKCKKHSENFNLMNINNMCVLLKRFCYYRPDILELGFRKLLANLEDARIKEIERIFLSLSFFNHQIDVSNEVMNEIENHVLNLSVDSKHSFENFPQFYESLLLHCVTLKMYPKRLIDLVFGEKMKLRYDGDYPNISKYLTIHTTLLMEAPKQYTNVQSPKVVEEMKKMFNSIVHDHGRKVGIFEKWEKNLSTMFPGRVKAVEILPFLPFPDLVIFDETSLTNNFKIDLRPNTVYGASCIVILYQSAFCDRFLRRSAGVTALKMRLLQKLGFKLYCIPFFADVLRSENGLEIFRVLKSNQWAFNDEYHLL